MPHRTPMRGLRPLVVLLLCLPLLAQAALTSVTLQLREPHQFANAGYYAAVHKGFYQNAGLQVQLVEGGSSSDPMASVLSGRADFGVAGPELLIDYLKGRPLALLCPVMQHAREVLIVPRAGALLSDLASAGPIIVGEGARDVPLRAMFRSEGMKVQLLAQERTLDQILRQHYAAFRADMTREPQQLRQRGVDYTLISPRSYGLDFYGDLLFTRQELLQKQPALAAAFQRASLQGWEYALAHPDEIIALIQSQYDSQHLDIDQLRHEARTLGTLIAPGEIPLGHNSPGRWQYIVQTYARAGLVDSRLATELPAGLLDAFLPDADASRELPVWLLPAAVAGLVIILLLIAATILLLRMKRRLQRVRNELQASQLMLEEAQRLANLGSWEYDLGSNVLSLSEEARNLLAPDHRGLPLGLADLVASLLPEDRPRLSQALDEARRLGTDFDIEYRVQSRRGGRRFLRMRAHVFQDASGRSLRMVGSVLDITARRQHEQRLQESAQTDYLTGISNRDHLMEEGSQGLQRAIRQDAPMSVVLIAVDSFRKVQEAHGHTVADQVLINVTRIMQEALRGADRIGRIGSEEFAIVLPDTDAARARLVCERIRSAIATAGVTLPDGRNLQVTVSIGLTDWQTPRDSFDLMLNRADQALYSARQRGRNRVCVSGQEGAG